MAGAVVQVIDAESTSPVSSQPVTFGSSTTAGNAVAVLVTTYGTGVTSVSATDSKGNTYTPVAGAAAGNGTDKQWVLVAKNIAGGASHQVTVTPNASCYVSVAAVECSGIDLTTPVRTSGATTGTSAAPSPGSLASTAGDLVLGLATTSSATTTWTVGSGFTGRVNKANAAVYEPMLVESWVSDGTTKAADWTTSASVSWVASSVVLQAAAGGGGSTYTLTAAAGSFTLAGQAAGLKVGRKVAASAGTFSLSGQAASLLAAHRLAAAAGTFALTGNAATLTRTQPGSYSLAASAGSFSLAGNAAGLLVAHRLTAAAGAYALAGNAAGLILARRLAAVAGSFAATGTAANLLAGRRLAAVVGAFALTGNAASLVRQTPGAYTLAAGAGAFLLTGNAAGLRADRRLSALAGPFVLTGNVADLVHGTAATAYVLTAGAGAFVVTGNAAGFLRTRRLTASAGGFVLTGRAATLTYSGDVVVLPTSLLAAIRRRFYADAALTAAIPGGLLPGIPPGSTALPWAVIVPVGEAESESATGPGGASLWHEEFQVSVTCRSDQAKADPTSGNEDACWAAKRLFYAKYNYKGDASDLDWEDGWCLSITPTNAHLSPQPEFVKDQVKVRQVVFTLKALTARVF